MAGWSQTIIVGNVGRDPETRLLPSGVQVTSFSVAVSKRWNDRNTNEQKEKTTWYRVTCWRNLAEIANNYVKKGTQIMVVGNVEVRAYTDNSGQPQASLDLTADTFQLLGSRDGQGQGQYAQQGQSGRDFDDFGGENLNEIPF